MSTISSPAGPPHPVLSKYFVHAEQKPVFVTGLFDQTAAHYDRINAVAFLGTGGWYRRQALHRAGLRPGMRLLDVACGTGALSKAAARIIGDESIVGCDPAAGMLALAARKVRHASFVQASAERLPFEPASFDFLTMGYALRHVGDLGQTFQEYHRVLARGGRLLIMEVTKPSSTWKAALARLYFRDVVPVISRLVTRDRHASTLMRYFWETIDACVSPEFIVDQLQQSGFRDVQRKVQLGLFSEYTGTKAST